LYSHLDLSKSVQKPKLFLCKPNRKIIAPLNEVQNEQLFLKLKGVNTLTFDLPYLIQKHHELVGNQKIDLIKNGYLVKLIYGDMEEWFTIKTPNPESDQTDLLHVKCLSIEDKLRKNKIFGYKKDAIQVNVVANDILANTGWSLGTYPTNGDYRQFDINSKTTLEVLNTIAETFDTLLYFDTVNKTVNFYSKDYFSTFYGLVVSEKKYLQTFLREHNDEDFCTRLYVFGEKDLTINRLNPTGQPYIEDFSYYLYPFQRDSNGNVISSSDYMDDDLAIAILDYRDLLETKKTEYQSLLDQKSVLLDEMTTLQNQMNILETDMKQLEDELFVLQDSGSDTTTKEQEIANKQTEIDNKQIEIDNKQAEIDAVDADIQTIRNQCSKENNFTQLQLDELNEHYVDEGEFRDENIKEDAVLYDKGLEILQERKVPSFKIMTGIVNFKEMITEQKNWDKLSLGSVIRVKKESMGQDVKSQVTEIEFNFEEKDIRLVQSNSVDYMDTKDRMIKNFYLSQESADILSSKKGEWDSAEENSVEYIDKQINDVNVSISELDKGFKKFASDGFISKDESNLMRNQKQQLNAESNDLVSVATSLEITTEKTNYQNALSDLNNALSAYIDLADSEYPKPILSSDRTTITNAFDSVQNTKSILNNAIGDKKDDILQQQLSQDINEVDNSLTDLRGDFNDAVSDAVVTEKEATNLSTSLDELKSESQDLLDTASNFKIDTARVNYNNAVVDLENKLSPFIGQTTYPISITSTERNDIKLAFENVQLTKSVLINVLTSESANKARVYDPFFKEGKNFYSAQYIGEYVNTLTDGTKVVGVGLNGGDVLEFTGEHRIFYKYPIAIDPNRYYRVRFRVRQTVDPSSGTESNVYAGVATLDSNYNELTGGSGTHRYCGVSNIQVTSTDGWMYFEGDIHGEGDTHYDFRPNTVYVRPMFIVNYSNGDGTAQVDFIDFLDVTQEYLSKEHANNVANDAENNAKDYTDNLRTDLRVDAPLPTDVSMGDYGIRAVTPSDPNKYAQLDYRGLYIKHGAIQVERPDGFNTLIDGKVNFGLDIQGAQPMYMGKNVSVDGFWWKTNNTTTTGDECNFYTFEHKARYLKVFLCQYVDGGEGYVTIESTGSSPTVYATSTTSETDTTSSIASSGKIITVDLGVPTGGTMSVYIRMRSSSTSYVYSRVKRLWLEG